jgi:hypothetical protein
VSAPIEALGALPDSPDAALVLANRRAKKKMSAEQVYLYTLEATSNVYLPDRYGFLSTSTLKNAAQDANAGVAFLSSHNWDSLPLGATTAGYYEKFAPVDGGAKGLERVLMSVYAPRGFYPNGPGSVGTDEVNQGIETGVLFDVSIGLTYGPGASMVCNVCAKDYYGGECNHVRGTTFNIDEEDQKAQETAGVPGGVCTITFEGFRTTEISAVFDGAAAGAGFLSPSNATTNNKAEGASKEATAPIATKDRSFATNPRTGQPDAEKSPGLSRLGGGSMTLIERLTAAFTGGEESKDEVAGLAASQIATLTEQNATLASEVSKLNSEAESLRDQVSAGIAFAQAQVQKSAIRAYGAGSSALSLAQDAISGAGSIDALSTLMSKLESDTPQAIKDAQDGKEAGRVSQPGASAELGADVQDFEKKSEDGAAAARRIYGSSSRAEKGK